MIQATRTHHSRFRTILIAILFFVNNANAETKLALETKTYRIVSLNPSITEILFALGLGSSIVGTSEFSDTPEAAKAIPRIGAYGRPNIEKVITLQPTHVVAIKEGEDTISSQLKKANIQMVIVDARHIKDFPDMITNLGSQFQKQPKAELMKKAWQAQWKELKVSKTRRRLLLFVDVDPLFAAGGDTFISEGITLCGHKNVLEEKKGYVRIGAEYLEILQPESMVFAGHLPNQQTWEDLKKKWARSPNLKSAQSLVFDSTSIGRLTLSFPKAVNDLCKQLERK